MAREEVSAQDGLFRYLEAELPKRYRDLKSRIDKMRSQENLLRDDLGRMVRIAAAIGLVLEDEATPPPVPSPTEPEPEPARAVAPDAPQGESYESS